MISGRFVGDEMSSLTIKKHLRLAWTIHLNVITHKLSLCREAKTMAEKRIRLGEEKMMAALEETDKLLQAGFIWEIQYTTWLANVLLVKKLNGKWRICTYYTNLNKACPKDLYLFPSINQLVDGASGQAMLSFLDAYSGYNKIPMYGLDISKTTFNTKVANYCYHVMPFGLTNVGATYKKLMDKAF